MARPPLVHYGMNSSVHVPMGYPQVGSSIALLPGHTYHVSLAVQATPPGTTVELLAGLWHITKFIDQEFAPHVRANYTGSALQKLEVTGHGWQELTATVVVPPDASPTPEHNGTALQLRVTPPTSERGWGATVWFDAAEVVDAADL